MVYEKGVQSLTEQLRLSHKLIDNMLPSEIRQRMARHPGQRIADDIANCSIMFACFTGIDKLAGKHSTLDIINVLNELWCQVG